LREKLCPESSRYATLGEKLYPERFDLAAPDEKLYPENPHIITYDKKLFIKVFRACLKENANPPNSEARSAELK
jgi:hypothetical protein